MNQYNDYRKIYVNNLINNEYPILPAYFFYLEHKSGFDLLNINEFTKLFIKGVKSYIHPISLEIREAQMDIEKVQVILNDYFNIQYLYDVKGELIKIV